MFRLANPLAQRIEESFLEDSVFSGYANYYLVPLVLIVINQIIIPALIDLETIFETIETKSNYFITILRKNFFFMTLSAILLPIAGYISIREYLRYALEQL